MVTYLISLPDTSIAKQCLLLSNQLANNGKSSFILSFHETMKLNCSTYIINLQVSNIFVKPKMVNSKLPKIKQAIIDDFKKYQMKKLRSYKKLNFYSTFKTDVSRSEYLDLIKNEKDRQAVAKLRSSNHKLIIKTDRYHLPKIPENPRICKFCSSNKVENEIHFLLECNLYSNLSKTLFSRRGSQVLHIRRFEQIGKNSISF